MANVIKHKRGSGSDPSASNLVIGELAIRTDNGKLFTKMDSGAIAEIAGGGSDIAINTLSSSSATGGGSATFNGSAYRFTLSSPPSVSAAQLLVSVNGVIQKPVAGTGQPSEGFSVDGNDIIFGDAPATGADFFILTFRSLGVSEPAANSVTNAKVASNAAIAGTKISPDFGSQDIVTTGLVRVGTDGSNFKNNLLRFKSSGDAFIDNHTVGQDIVFRVGNSSTLDTTPLRINSDGHVDVTGNLDVGAGIDVTGAITGTGDMTIDTNTLHVDSTNNRVGIGTTSPTEELTISSATPAVKLEDTDQANSYVQFSAANGDLFLSANGASSQGQFLLRSGNGGSFTERMRIDSSGNLLSGTTSSSLLSNFNANAGGLVLDDIGSGATAFLATHGDKQIFLGNDTSANYLWGYSNHDLLFGTNNQPRMTINSSGNVGIGTTSPDTLLHLAGADTAVIRLENTDTTLGTDQIIGGIEFEKQDATGAGVGIAGAIRLKSMSSVGQAASMFFSTSNSSGNDQTRMTLDFDGNVGIGIASPNRTLHQHVDSSAANYHLFTNTGTGTAASDGGIVGIDANENLILWNQENTNLRFATNNTERVRITSGGQFQISPSGSAKISIYHDSSGNLNHITSNNGNEFKVSSGNGDANGIEFWDYTGVNKRCQIDGHGIKFNSDTAAANALDDYEEGTWTVGVDARAVTGSEGHYTKIGRFVVCQFRFNGLNAATTGANISGLPFTSKNSNQIGICTIADTSGVSYASGFSDIYGRVNANASNVQLLAKRIDGSTHTSSGSFTLGTNVVLRGYVWYMTD